MGLQGWMKGEAVVVCVDEGDGDEAELWFFESCGARPCGVRLQGEEAARELPRHARRVATRAIAHWLKWNIMCKAALTSIWLVKAYLIRLKAISST